MQSSSCRSGPGLAYTAWTKEPWQRTQFSWTITRSRGVISIGSLKFWRVKATECRNPWSAFATHFPRPAAGR
jgi:hypothetical protein